MRVMVLVKGDPTTEAGQLPQEGLVDAMTRFNEELASAGVLLAADGLHPSAKGARVRFEGSKRTVIGGPFSESKELVAGYWIWQVRSLEEAIEWLKRAPFDGGTEVEIRPIFESEEFLENYDPSLRTREERLKATVAEGDPIVTTRSSGAQDGRTRSRSIPSSSALNASSRNDEGAAGS